MTESFMTENRGDKCDSYSMTAVAVTVINPNENVKLM